MSLLLVAAEGFSSNSVFTSKINIPATIDSVNSTTPTLSNNQQRYKQLKQRGSFGKRNIAGDITHFVNFASKIFIKLYNLNTIDNRQYNIKGISFVSGSDGRHNRSFIQNGL